MRSSLLLITLWFVLTVGVNAQTLDDDVVKVESDLVIVPAIVLDRSGKYISTLKQEDFKVFEDGVERKIEHFETAESNVTVLILLERTGTRNFQLPALVKAANSFVKQLRPEDRLIALSFGYGTDTLIKETTVQDVPKGVKVKRHSNDRATLLYDAVATGLKRISKISGRKAIVLFSQGIDPEMYSSHTLKSTLEDAEKSEATIYTIQVDPVNVAPAAIRNASAYQKKLQNAEEYMEKLASITGGRTFKVAQIENLDATFAEVARDVVKQFVIGYEASKSKSKTERRIIKVEVSVPGSFVRARKDVLYKN